MRPLPVPGGRGARWAALVVVFGLAVAAVGLLGPRATPIPPTGPAVEPPTAAEILEPPSRTAPRRPSLDVVARQVGGEVIVDGRASASAGPLLVALEFEGTRLATAAVAPRDGTFEAVLRPRVPFGGLIGRLLIRVAGDATGVPALDRSLVLVQTTHGRRTVDPTTGRTSMAVTTP